MLGGDLTSAALLVATRKVLVKGPAFAVRILGQTRVIIAVIDRRTMSSPVRAGIWLQLLLLLGFCLDSKFIR